MVGGRPMRRPKVALLASLVLVGLLLVAIGTAGAAFPNLSAATQLAPPSPADEATIKAVVDQSFWLDGEAARTVDISQFSTVYANDPSIGPSQEQSELIARVKASNPLAVYGDGFLDYKRAF